MENTYDNMKRRRREERNEKSITYIRMTGKEKAYDEHLIMESPAFSNVCTHRESHEKNSILPVRIS